jgi:hypothetical protein
MARKNCLNWVVLGVAFEIVLLGTSSAAAPTNYQGMVRTDSGQAVVHARVDAMYAPFTLFQMRKPRVTLASTYSNEHGAFSLSLPAYIREKPSYITALKIVPQDRIMLNGQVNRPKEYRQYDHCSRIPLGVARQSDESGWSQSTPVILARAIRVGR